MPLVIVENNLWKDRRCISGEFGLIVSRILKTPLHAWYACCIALSWQFDQLLLKSSKAIEPFYAFFNQLVGYWPVTAINIWVLKVYLIMSSERKRIAIGNTGRFPINLTQILLPIHIPQHGNKIFGDTQPIPSRIIDNLLLYRSKSNSSSTRSKICRKHRNIRILIWCITLY